jgi:hypothetical protein
MDVGPELGVDAARGDPEPGRNGRAVAVTLKIEDLS